MRFLLQISRKIQYWKNFANRSTFVKVMNECIVAQFFLTHGQGHREFPFWKRKIPPRQRKNSRKFPFGKMLDFARSNIISTQTSNIYLNQLQWYGQFAKCTCYLKSKVLKSTEISLSPTFHPSHMSRLTGSDRSPFRCINNPHVRTDVPRTLPRLRTSYLEHLPSQADESKTLAYDLLELFQRPHSCTCLLYTSDAADE